VTKETVDRYRVQITVGMAVVCILFLVGTSFRIGAEQTRIETELGQNAKGVQECKEKTERQADEQTRINTAVSGALIEIKRDLQHIKEGVDDLKRDKGR